LINVYSITFVGLNYWLVHSLLFFSALLNVCGCLPFELGMIIVIPYGSRHEVVYNTFIMETETEPKTEVFSPKPTETDRQEKF